MKLLYITTVARSKFGSFAKSSIEAARQLGDEYHIASNETGIDQSVKEEECHELGIFHHHIDIARSPAAVRQNYRAYRQIMDLINMYKIDVIHCNTPMGGVLGRICGHKAAIKAIIYQAHGFHFWKGAPIKNWIEYYPVEKALSKHTDILVTINREDYDFAKKKLKASKILYIPGVGADLSRFNPCKEKKATELRIKYGLGSEDVVLLSVGELNENKNHKTVIKSIKIINDPHIHYFIAGTGCLEAEIKEYVSKMKLNDQVHLLGFRSDIPQLCDAADIFVFPSKREGLPISVMEAMASGLPCIVSKIRGNTDLIKEDVGGFTVPPMDSDLFAQRINELATNKSLRIEMGKNNSKNVKDFEMNTIIQLMKDLYSSI